jgi:hypothetical protein
MHKFKNLTSLALNNARTTTLMDLCELEHLQKLTFTNSRFSLIEEILPELGNQLLCLNLINVAGTDLRTICANCHLLECLHLSFNISQFLVLPILHDWERPLPALEKIITLKLHVDDRRVVEPILDYICNVKRLVMEYTFDDDETFLERIIQRNWLKNLEELYWGCSIVVTFSQGVTTVHEFYSDGRISVHHTLIEASSF